MKVDTYSHNTGEKLCTFVVSLKAVENHRVCVLSSGYELRYEGPSLCWPSFFVIFQNGGFVRSKY